MYYAMLGETQVGPMTLDQLAALGVRPDTYIWCKGMDDWGRADANGDICRYFRQRLSRLRHPVVTGPSEPESPQPITVTQEEDYSAVPPRFRYYVSKAGGPAPDPVEHDPADHDPATPPPAGMLPVALLATLICFPVTGIVAVYFAIKARNFWAEAKRSDSKSSGPLYSDGEREAIRNQMADAVRQCKMWTGITICMGLILYAALIHLL